MTVRGATPDAGSKSGGFPCCRRAVQNLRATD
jgi:hypothetical protein